MKKHIYLLFAASIIMVHNLSAQVYHDNFPKTVPRNADIGESTAKPFKNGSVKDGPITNFFTTGTRWNNRILSYFFENGTPDIANDGGRQAVRDGFALWAAQTNLAFMETCNAANADIVIFWGAGAHGDPVPECAGGLRAFDGLNGVLAHNMGGPGPNNCGIQSGDLHFDEDEIWTLNLRADGAQPIDLVSVATHEIGHALGLFHTGVAGSVMEAAYTGSRRALGADDIAGIRSIYGFPSADQMITGNNIVCSSGTQYSVPNQPAGTTVTWSATPASLFSVASGTGATFSPVAASGVNSTGTITATIASACGNVTLSRNVGVSSALPTPTISIIPLNSGAPANCVIRGNNYRFDAGMHPNVNLDGGYEWIIPSGWTYRVGQGSRFLDLGLPVSGSYSPVVQVRLKNACTTGSYAVRQVNTCGGGFSLQVWPNPADGQFSVAATPATDTEKAGPTVDAPVADEYVLAVEADIRLMDAYSQTLWQGRMKKGRVTVPTAKIRDGLYYLIIEGEQPVSKQIMIRH